MTDGSDILYPATECSRTSSKNLPCRSSVSMVLAYGNSLSTLPRSISPVREALHYVKAENIKAYIPRQFTKFTT